MAPTTAREVADYIIWFSHKHGDPISNLKLQKLLYYAHAWYLAIHNKPLFDEDFEAWVHGPVIPSVYHAFKDWAWKPIEENPRKPALPRKVEKHLEEIMDVYGSLSAYQLEKLAHREKPWRVARGPIPNDALSRAKISNKEMKAFYRALADG